jgi:cystathionine beta-synthase
MIVINTAIELAIVCRQKGYNLKIVIRNTTDPEKIKMLEVLGVDFIKVEASLPPDNRESYYNYALI